MKVFNAIKKRRSIRSFEKETISKEAVQKIFESLQWAPSGHNLQPRKFIIVEDEELKEELAVACKNQWFVSEAAIVLVGLSSNHLSKYAKIDTAIALTNAMLEAVELGLGSCWVGSFDEKAVKTLLEIPDNQTIVGILPIGKPAETPKPTSRKSLNQIIFLNKFGKKTG